MRLYNPPANSRSHPLFSRHVVEIVKVRQIPTAYMYNAARSPVKTFVDKTFGSGSNICPKGAAAGELADIVVFGFVLESNVIEGRKYSFPGPGQQQTTTRVLKELQIMPLQQDFERLLAVLSMVWGGKVINLTVSEEGGITFSTKHTAVDEDGNAEKKSESIFYNTPSLVVDFSHQRPPSGASSWPRLLRPFLATSSILPSSVVRARARTSVRSCHSVIRPLLTTY